jgi:hypothetical protein
MLAAHSVAARDFLGREDCRNPFAVVSRTAVLERRLDPTLDFSLGFQMLDALSDNFAQVQGG